ncbi:MAG TPA: Ig-like domain repeat protein, partial [Acidimicrobiales bacterium]
AGIDTDLAFMNPGGLRADMAGTVSGELRNLTKRQAADVQPFANTMVNMDLTGAQIETVLEQQWQRNAQGGVPSRPFLRLGVSKGFTYTYVESPVTVSVPNSAPVNTFQGEVTGMWLNGTPVDPAATYSVTVNSFLGGGGDNFWELAHGTHKVDTGKVDLQAMVDYMAQYDAAHPLAVDYSQRAVEVTFPESAPEIYAGGDTVTFDVASWAMSAPGDKADTEIRVELGGQLLGTAPVSTTPSTTAYDNVGTASVSVTLPDNLTGPKATLKLVGATTGSEVPVIIPAVTPAPPPPPMADTTTSATAGPMTYGTDGTVQVTVTPATASGAVTITANGVTVGSGSVTNGAGTITVGGKTLAPGSHDLTVRYSGNATHNPSQGSVTVTVAKAVTSLTASAPAVEFGGDTTITITARPATAEGAVTVSEGGATLGAGTLSQGSGTVVVPGLKPGTHTLAVKYAGDPRHTEAATTVTVEVRKATSTTTATVTDSQIVVATGRTTIDVTVGAEGAKPTGSVIASIGGDRIASASLSNGRAALEVGPFSAAGAKSIELRYSGDDQVAGSGTTVTVEVVKATPRIRASHRPKVVKAGKTQVRLTVEVKAEGFTPGGLVTVTVGNGVTVRGRLEDGEVTVTLPKFRSAGTKVVEIAYEGNAKTKSATIEHEIEVVKKR